MIRTFVGGPLDGQSLETSALFVEAIEPDLRIAKYKATDQMTYELQGHYVQRARNGELVREFVPLGKDSGSPAD